MDKVQTLAAPRLRSRRRWLRSAAACTVLAGAQPVASAFAANDRINLAVVGLGGRGNQLLDAFLRTTGIKVVALCDVHRSHYRDRAWGTGPQLGLLPAQRRVTEHYHASGESNAQADCAVYTDYRELLSSQKLDAIVIATPDHWHAKITLDAIGNGLDVYCEKPVTHLFREGQLIYREAQQRQTVFQVGSQQRSDGRFRRAVEIVRNGHIGQVQRVEVGLPIGYRQANGSTATAAIPAGLDYDLWCGPAAARPYATAWHHRWWRAVRDYGGGVLMDWIGHHNDIAHWGIGQSLGGPSRVEAIGWKPSACPEYDTPAEYEIRCQYPDGITSVIATSLRQGTKWIGENGWVWVNRGKIEASDPRWLDPDFEVGPWHAYRSSDHVQNFVDCIRSRQACVTNAEIGHRSITPGHLGYISHQLSRPIEWDSHAETIKDDPEAQQLLTSVAYRAPWTLE